MHRHSLPAVSAILWLRVLGGCHGAPALMRTRMAHMLQNGAIPYPTAGCVQH